MHHSYKRLLSSFLASASLFSTLPVQAFAALQQPNEVGAEIADPLLTEQDTPTADALARYEQNQAAVHLLAQEESDVAVLADILTYGDLDYTVSGNEVTIIGCDIDATSVDIPSQIDGYPVTSIDYSAFSSCISLTRVSIPDSVTSIGEWAFSDCSSLTSVTIPTSVTSIGNFAFDGCSSLTDAYYAGSETQWNTIEVGVKNAALTSVLRYGSTDSGLSKYGALTYTTQDNQVTITRCDRTATSVDIPAQIDGYPVTAIGRSAFDGCSSLTRVTIPDSVTSLGKYAFADCTGLTGVTIPDSMTSLGDWAFYNCSSLTGVTIPDSVVSIGDWAFYDCSSLTRVTIPDSVTSIGDYVFSDCSSLTNITIPNGVTSIGDDVFYDCSSLTNITIPNSVTSIGSAAFHGCSSLTSITIPDSVTSIDDRAFYGCSSLTSIAIPNGVTSIVDYVFYDCSSLTNITIPNSVTSIGSAAFHGCSSLTSITIPDSVTSIDDRAFYGCSSLTRVTIPTSVTSIWSFAFYGCTGLTDAYYAGSETLWNTIDVGTGNDALTSVLRYNSTGPDPSDALDYTITTITPQDGGVNIAIAGKASKDGRLVVAVYTNEGKLLTTSIKNVTATQLAAGTMDVAVNTSGGAYISAFLLENDSKPLASKKIQKL